MEQAAKKKRNTPAQKKALERYNLVVRMEDNYRGSVFVTPSGAEASDRKVKAAYDACVALGMTYENGL